MGAGSARPDGRHVDVAGAAGADLHQGAGRRAGSAVEQPRRGLHAPRHRSDAAGGGDHRAAEPVLRHLPGLVRDPLRFSWAQAADHPDRHSLCGVAGGGRSLLPGGLRSGKLYRPLVLRSGPAADVRLAGHRHGYRVRHRPLRGAHPDSGDAGPGAGRGGRRHVPGGQRLADFPAYQPAEDQVGVAVWRGGDQRPCGR